MHRYTNLKSYFVSFIAVNQALDACIWLKSAGFPQYVQKFEGLLLRKHLIIHRMFYLLYRLSW